MIYFVRLVWVEFDRFNCGIGVFIVIDVIFIMWFYFLLIMFGISLDINWIGVSMLDLIVLMKLLWV